MHSRAMHHQPAGGQHTPGWSWYRAGCPAGAPTHAPRTPPRRRRHSCSAGSHTASLRHGRITRAVAPRAHGYPAQASTGLCRKGRRLACRLDGRARAGWLYTPSSVRAQALTALLPAPLKGASAPCACLPAPVRWCGWQCAEGGAARLQCTCSRPAPSLAAGPAHENVKR